MSSAGSIKSYSGVRQRGDRSKHGSFINEVDKAFKRFAKDNPDMQHPDWARKGLHTQEQERKKAIELIDEVPEKGQDIHIIVEKVTLTPYDNKPLACSSAIRQVIDGKETRVHYGFIHIKPSTFEENLPRPAGIHNFSRSSRSTKQKGASV